MEIFLIVARVVFFRSPPDSNYTWSEIQLKRDTGAAKTNLGDNKRKLDSNF